MACSWPVVVFRAGIYGRQPTGVILRGPVCLTGSGGCAAVEALRPSSALRSSSDQPGGRGPSAEARRGPEVLGNGVASSGELLGSRGEVAGIPHNDGVEDEAE